MMGDSLAEVLRAIVRILVDADESRPARDLNALAKRAEEGHGKEEHQKVVLDVLALYGGMGSFQDLVLQDERGVRPEQPELDRLRAKLFRVARDELA